MTLRTVETSSIFQPKLTSVVPGSTISIMCGKTVAVFRAARPRHSARIKQRPVTRSFPPTTHNSNCVCRTTGTPDRSASAILPLKSVSKHSAYKYMSIYTLPLHSLHTVLHFMQSGLAEVTRKHVFFVYMKFDAYVEQICAQIFHRLCHYNLYSIPTLTFVKLHNC